MSMISKCFQLQPENLPPTERAAFYHSLRVHLQICQWKTLNLEVLDATKWGWIRDDKTLVPIKTDQPCVEIHSLQLQIVSKKPLWYKIVHMQKEWHVLYASLWRLPWRIMQ